jgi:hypothetical protein
MRPFAAHDDPHPGGPASQVEQSGHLGNIGAVPGSSSAVTAGGHARSGTAVIALVSAAVLVGSRPSTPTGGRGPELCRSSPTARGWRRHRRLGSAPASPCGRALGDRSGQYIDVVPGMITGRVPRPQRDSR